MPIYRRTTSNEHFSIENLARILLDSDTAVSTGRLKVCSTQPVQVCHVTFLVDLNALDDPMDIRDDENDAWDRKGSPVAYISLHKNGGTTSVYEQNKLGCHSNHYKIARTYWHSSPDFTRIITTVHGEHCKGKCMCTPILLGS